MSQALQLATNWIELGLVPDAVIRRGIHTPPEARFDVGDDECNHDPSCRITALPS